MSAQARAIGRDAATWTLHRRREATSAAPGERPWVRLGTFAALAAYGVQRWASLLRPAPTWRLVGLLAVAVALAGGVPLMARRRRLPAAVTALLLVLVAFPVAGLRWHWFIHLRIAASADQIGRGLQALPNSLVPYLGASHAVRLVIVLGAAVLLLDAAVVVGSAPRDFGDARRAAAALPLLALAVVPSTLIRPEFPYLQGLVLFTLLAAFLWGERIRHGAVATATGIVALAGIAGAIAAPRVDQGRPWVNYRAWAGTLATQHVDRFDWNQTYGPLRWPQSGHQVLAVRARTGEYWKAEDLNAFNGYGWAPAAVPVTSQLGADPRAVARWSQTIQVSIQGLVTQDVIAAGDAGQPAGVPGGVLPGLTAGTSWLAVRPMGPGTSYAVRVYAPQPSPTELAGAGARYPVASLRSMLSMALPQANEPPTAFAQLTFPIFHSPTPIHVGTALQPADPLGSLRRSVYGPVYAIAHRLAGEAATPYAYALSIERFLANGYSYNQTPPARRYPIVSFILHTKIGYCQQFAGAMALLLRMGGVPARVATGFTSGMRDSSTGQWLVSDTDAHAWVEAWFPHYGWVRFEPTPASAPARGGATGSPIVKPSIGGARSPVATFHREIGTANLAGHTPIHHGGGGPSPWVFALGLALLGALALPMHRVARARAGAGDLLGELERALARTRRPLQDGVTLVALERRLGSSPEAAAYVRALRMERYGGAARLPTAAQRRALRQELSRGLGLGGRVRAWWAMPPWLASRASAPSRPQRS